MSALGNADSNEVAFLERTPITPTVGNSTSATRLKCTEADAGAGKNKIVASMKALGWPLSSSRDCPAAIEAAVSAAEAAIAAVTAATTLHPPGPPGTSDNTSELVTEAENPLAPELQTDQSQWGPRAVGPRGHVVQMLPPIAEDSLLGDQSAQAFIDASSSQANTIAINCIAPGCSNTEAMQSGANNAHVDAWIHGWAAQVSELLGYFSREIARLVERMDEAEQKMTAAIEGRPQDAPSNNEQCKELAATFTEALKMEREARMYETAQLRAALCGANPNPILNSSNSASQLAEHLVQVAGVECDRFAKILKDEWKEFSEGAASLRSNMSTELKEQHAWATLDIAEQHTAAVRVLVAEHGVQACEVAELQNRLRDEISEIASEVTEEVIERQDRERQCTELRIALQQAAQDGTLLPCVQSSQSSAVGETRRRGLSGSGRNYARRSDDLSLTQTLTTALPDSVPQRTVNSDATVNYGKINQGDHWQASCTEGKTIDHMYYHGDLSALLSATSAPAISSAAVSTTASQAGSKADYMYSNSPLINVTSLASRAEAAVRGDLMDFSGSCGQTQESIVQDSLVDRFGASLTLCPERRSANGTRGVSPERRSPTRASRLLPPPSVVLPPPSQPLP